MDKRVEYEELLMKAFEMYGALAAIDKKEEFLYEVHKKIKEIIDLFYK